MGQKRRWTEDEFELLAYLAAQIPRPSITVIAKQLNRSKSAIKNKIAMFPSSRTNRHYTENEIDFIRDNIRRLSFNEMATQLNRSSSSVSAMARRMGLRRNPSDERVKMLERTKALRDDGLTWKETVSIINKEFGKQYKPITLRQRLSYYQVTSS